MLTVILSMTVLALATIQDVSARKFVEKLEKREGCGYGCTRSWGPPADLEKRGLIGGNDCPEGCVPVQCPEGCSRIALYEAWIEKRASPTNCPDDCKIDSVP